MVGRPFGYIFIFVEVSERCNLCEKKKTSNKYSNVFVKYIFDQLKIFKII